MKHYRSAKVLFFISLLYLHCLPNYCDTKQDEPASIESVQANKVLPSDSSRAENVPSQQNEAEKLNLGLENSRESVQSNVEYVNNLEEKDAEEFVDRIGRIESPVIVQKLIDNESVLKSSRQPDPREVDKSENDDSQTKPMFEASAHTNFETEPLTSKVLTKSEANELQPSAVKSESSSENTASSQSVPEAKPEETIYSAAIESEKLLKEGDQQQYDDMPSFDEWKKMMLAEDVKGDQKGSSPTPGKKISSQKHRRNYSSYECGAKIIAVNNEAEGVSRILNELVDEYMLNPCKARIWFIIELCHSVHATQIELANFELFSSCPKEFAVYSSDSFPTREWIPLGTFIAAEQRVLQSFDLKQEGFGKFIKIEMISHYGREHYCPLSVVRIFGTTMVDEFEEMEKHMDSQPGSLDDRFMRDQMEEFEETMESSLALLESKRNRLDIPIEDKKPTNIFGSATDAVMNIVKKAAAVLGQQTVDDKQINDTASDPQNVSESKICSVMDSTDKCKEIPTTTKDSLPYLNGFSVTPSSMHQSVFRLLHRCDQCATSRVSYYSSAQPHCRFFQAALGPVVFQTLCDWFKEHPLAIAHESPAPGKRYPPGETFIISPTKSPPPQIMRIPSESDLSLKILLNDTLSSVSHSDKSLEINITTLPLRMNKSTSTQDNIVLQSSIKPTHALQSDQVTLYNRSIETSGTSSNENVPSADGVSEFLTKASVAIPEKTEGSAKETVSETATHSAVEFTATSELSESEEEQISDFLSEASVDGLSIAVVPATELPPVIRPGDEKVVNMRSDFQGKLEPVPFAGTTTAGQKESVFMRMSNRIKALEINMSLSSQYLQELSQRYRRQMDEMQRAFNRTIGTLNDTARKAAEKDLKQQEVLNILQLQVANLTQIVELLLSERSLIFRQMIETHVCLMIVEAIIMITIMSLCVRRISSKQSPESRTPILSPSRLSKRRNSADSCSPAIARKVKKRSNSEENLTTGVINEPLPVLPDPTQKVKKKNKKRNKGIQRSTSHPTVQRNNSNALYTGKQHAHSDGCMLPKQSNKLSYACENCDNNSCIAAKISSKERRPNSLPLQNLTNGTVISSDQEKSNMLKGRERFSFKKFLRFQKRDSI